MQLITLVWMGVEAGAAVVTALRAHSPALMAFGAESGVGSMLLETMLLVATDVRGGVFTGGGHYMPEEAPRAVAEQVISFMDA